MAFLCKDGNHLKLKTASSETMWESNVLEIGDRAANRLNMGKAQFSSVSLGVANQSQGLVPQKSELNNLSVKLSSPVISHESIYPGNFSLLQMQSQGETFCRIDKDGRLIRDDIDITDNDKAMAECFVDYLKKFHKVEVKRGS